MSVEDDFETNDDHDRLMLSVWGKIEIHEGPEVFLSTFNAASRAARTLFAAHWVVSEVENGAFPQFFWNSTGVLAPEALEAFRDLGLSDAAQALSHAMSLIAHGPYPRDRAQRQTIVEPVWAKPPIPEGDKLLGQLLDATDQFLDGLGEESASYIKAVNRYASKHALQA